MVSLSMPTLNAADGVEQSVQREVPCADADSTRPFPDLAAMHTQRQTDRQPSNIDASHPRGAVTTPVQPPAPPVTSSTLVRRGHTRVHDRHQASQCASHPTFGSQTSPHTRSHLVLVPILFLVHTVSSARFLSPLFNREAKRYTPHIVIHLPYTSPPSLAQFVSVSVSVSLQLRLLSAPGSVYIEETSPTQEVQSHPSQSVRNNVMILPRCLRRWRPFSSARLL